jgi:hypothetical protein
MNPFDKPCEADEKQEMEGLNTDEQPIDLKETPLVPQQERRAAGKRYSRTPFTVVGFGK